MEPTRVIKFRVWDKENKVHYYLDSMSVGIENGNRYTDGRKLGHCKLLWQNQTCPEVKQFHFYILNNFVIQQFTGFKDSNDQDIYEGDKVKVCASSEFDGEIIWCQKDGGWNIKEIGGDRNPSLCDFMADCCSVKGHIYEQA